MCSCVSIFAQYLKQKKVNACVGTSLKTAVWCALVRRYSIRGHVLTSGALGRCELRSPFETVPQCD